MAALVGLHAVTGFVRIIEDPLAQADSMRARMLLQRPSRFAHPHSLEEPQMPRSARDPIRLA